MGSDSAALLELELLELELLEGGASPRIITPLTMVILLRPEPPAEDISAERVETVFFENDCWHCGCSLAHPKREPGSLEGRAAALLLQGGLDGG